MFVKTNLAGVSKVVKDRIDVFVCSLSFEKRCLAFPMILEANQIGCIYAASNKKLSGLVGGHENLLKARFGEKVVSLETDTSNPLITADSFVNKLADVISQQGMSIIIDITTFTHEALLILLKIMSIYCHSNNSVRLVYVTASEYSVGSPNEEKWLSKGVKEIRSVLGFPGEFLPSRKTHLVLLPGYESDRATEIIGTYESAVMSIGIGEERSATKLGHHITNKLFFERITSIYDCKKISHFEFSYSDPVKTTASILKEIEKFPAHNVILAPMNTKLSTVGAFFAAEINEQVQLCYAEAAVYNYLSYSTPGEDCYISRTQSMADLKSSFLG